MLELHDGYLLYILQRREQSEAGIELPYEDRQSSNVPEEFSDSFVRWVNYGETLCH